MMRGRADDDAARNAERAGSDHALARVAHDGACGNQKSHHCDHRPADALWPGMFRIRCPAGSLSSEECAARLVGTLQFRLDYLSASDLGKDTLGTKRTWEALVSWPIPGPFHKEPKHRTAD
jgi:hypothetical protein